MFNILCIDHKKYFDKKILRFIIMVYAMVHKALENLYILKIRREMKLKLKQAFKITGVKITVLRLGLSPDPAKIPAKGRGSFEFVRGYFAGRQVSWLGNGIYFIPPGFVSPQNS